MRKLGYLLGAAALVVGLGGCGIIGDKEASPAASFMAASASAVSTECSAALRFSWKLPFSESSRLLLCIEVSFTNIVAAFSLSRTNFSLPEWCGEMKRRSAVL